MPTLAVVPSLAAHQVAPGEVLLTKKFVDGMAKYAELWDGALIAIMHPQRDTSTGNLDDAVFRIDQLPFELRLTSFQDKSIYSALADADAVMLGGDDRLASLAGWCRRQGKKAIFVSEYSLRTRMQIIDAEVSNPIIRWRKYFWEWRQEKRNRRSVTLADAVQCNGTPTFDAYRELNPNTLLFLDSRVTSDMVADESAISTRYGNKGNDTPIRLAYSGRLTAMKGADDLTVVAEKLREMNIPFTLDVYGDGDLRPVMTQRIRDAGLEKLVRLHGVVDYATELLPAIKSTVDLFVCCHRQGDPSCTYIETFACGVPIVGYANEALQGLTRDHAVGWTSPLNRPELLAQRIADLYRNSEELRQAGSAALTLARRHTFEKEFGARIAQIRELMPSERAVRMGNPSRELAEDPAQPRSQETRPSPMATPELKLPITELATERLRSLRRRQLAARLRSQAMDKPFPDDSAEKLLLITQEERIPQSQIFPFHYFADQIGQRFGATIREADLYRALSSASELPADATVIAFQTPYDIADDDLTRLIETMRGSSPHARLVYLDWSAPADLRNAERLNPHIDLYVKKHALRDRNEYGRTTLGDTNLADHYARRLGVDEQEYTFPIPSDFMRKLHIGPSFVTAPQLLPQLLQPFDPGPERPIDLHARFAVGGTPWYQAMRSEAETALDQFSDLHVAVGNTLPLYRFLAELRRAKVCFSPFGYGEVCWRDYESVMAGTVLLKPDMSHIETQPDIFRPWETYVPLRWDLADLGETLRKLLADDNLRHSIATHAHAVLHEYLQSGAFVAQMRPLLSGAAR